MVTRISLAQPFIDDKMRQVMIDVLDSGRWVKGVNAKAFGGEFAHYCGALAGVPCSSGSSSLIAALRLLDIGPGDEVVVPSLTFFASVSCIALVGASPVFIDVEEDYWCLDPKKMKQVISKKTKAIIGVHLFGQPFSKEIIGEIPVIEDAAQAHGAMLGDSMTGAIGDIACFSFFPSKNMSVGGEGGMLTTIRMDIAERLQSWVDHGRGGDSSIEALTSNMRMSEMLAAIGRVQLEHLDQWQQQRRDIAARHTVVVDGNPLLQAPLVRPGAIHGWHQYTIRCEDSQSFMTHFDSKGIDSRLHYNIPCHRQPVMKGHPQHPQGSLPLTELLAEQLVSIPVHPHLDEDEISRIHYALADFGKI